MVSAVSWGMVSIDISSMMPTHRIISTSAHSHKHGHHRSDRSDRQAIDSSKVTVESTGYDLVKQQHDKRCQSYGEQCESPKIGRRDGQNIAKKKELSSGTAPGVMNTKTRLRPCLMPISRLWRSPPRTRPRHDSPCTPSADATAKPTP